MIATISDDFDLQKIADSGQCFRCSESGGVYRFITGKNILYIKQKAAFEYEVSCTFDVWEMLVSFISSFHAENGKGVGDKVANCIMLFAYGRMASAPVDTWINKVIADQYHGRNPFPMYGNNAGIMQQYAFYYMQQNKAKAG